MLWWRAGSTQEEVSSIVEASIKDSKISGTDRPVAWDGATTGGQDLQNQVMCSAHHCSPTLLRTVSGTTKRALQTISHPQHMTYNPVKALVGHVFGKGFVLCRRLCEI